MFLNYMYQGYKKNQPHRQPYQSHLYAISTYCNSASFASQTLAVLAFFAVVYTYQEHSEMKAVIYTNQP